ncbi:hypothetical protein VTN31DRAFT_70 [Thermomyces dupontii]|uniref:uncharacterized protein n=1 Tax=Talaromyces thermophilus TaxID=28565 RepID=UPI0037421135
MTLLALCLSSFCCMSWKIWIRLTLFEARESRNNGARSCRAMQLLGAFCHEKIAALGLENASVLTADASSYFRWLHGLQSACPVKKVFVRWPHCPVDDGCVPFASTVLHHP